MKILQVAAGDFFSTYGGGQVYVKNLVDEMICQGMNLAVISFVSTGIQGCLKKDYKSIQLYEVGNVGDDELKNLIREITPDIIHVHSRKGLICSLGSELGIPVVVTAHHGGIVCPAGTLMNCRDVICRDKACFRKCLPCVLRNTRSGRYWYPFMRLLPHKLYSRWGRWLRSKPFIPFITPIGLAAATIDAKEAEWHSIASNATVVIAPCEELGKALVRNGLQEKKLRVITHGIHMAENSQIKSMTDDQVDFFYVGRISYVKGLHVLIKAFMKVTDNKLRLHLIGGASTKAEKRYLARLQKLGNADKRILWHGKVSPQEVFEKTLPFHIAVSPSICLEAFGLNIAEALAQGKPVLTTCNGGSEMQIEEGVNGWLVPQNDVDALAEKIAYIATHGIRLDVTHAKPPKTLATHAAELSALYTLLIADE